MDSLGIISLMLLRVRTAQSRFDIPLKIHLDFVCSKIKLDSDATCLLKEMKVIIWDGATMTYMRCFEALDRGLEDFMHRPASPFEGLVIVFVGEFRHISPVVAGGSRSEIVDATICSSKI